MKKRLISMLLVLTMMIGMVPAFAVNVGAYDNLPLNVRNTITAALSAHESGNYEYYLATYLVEFVSDGNKGMTYDEVLRARSDTLIYTQIEEIENKMPAKRGFGYLYDFLEGELGNTISGLDEYEFYMGLLWQLVTRRPDSTIGDTTGIQEGLDVCSSIFDNFLTWYQESALENNDMSLSEIEKEFLLCDFYEMDEWMDKYEAYLKQSNKLKDIFDENFFEKISSVLDTLSEFANGVEIGFNWIEKSIQIAYILELSDSYTNIFREMLVSANNSNMSHSLIKAVEQILNILEAQNFEQAIVKYLFSQVAYEGTEFFLSQANEKLVDAIGTFASKAPVLGEIWAGLQLGMKAADFLIGAGAKIDAGYHIIALSDLLNLIFDSSATIKNKYISNPSKWSSAYVTACELSKDSMIIACDISKEWLVAQYETGFIDAVVEFFGGYDGYHEWLEVLEEEKVSINNSFERLGKIAREFYDDSIEKYYKEIYSITYNANRGTGAPASQENTGTVTLSTTTPTRTGYSFQGWAESATGAVKYQPGKSYTFPEGNVTLYAVWQPKTFNIIFDANGGVFKAYDNATTVTRQKAYAQNFTFDVTYPVMDGYKCIGWSLENDNTVDWENGETENDIGAANANDKRVYAVWAVTTVDVKYDYNDGSTVLSVVKVDIQNDATYTIQKPVKAKESLKNYFKGWMIQDPKGEYWWTNGSWDNGKVYIVQPGDTIELTTKVVLYAKWDYYVHYNDGTEYYHDVVRDGDGYVIDGILNAPSGKEFKCWKGEDANGNVVYYKPGDTINLTSDLMLTAVWTDGSTVESYVTVSYNANGGRGSIADDEVVAGGRVTLEDGDSLYRNGYEFVGWATEPDATSYDYLGGKKITVEEDITLYAVWKAVGDGTSATITVSADKKVYKPGDTITLKVLADHSDHFYIDADDARFNILRQDGSTIHTGGVFVEKNSPSNWFPKNRYVNGKEYEVELFIPNNCSDGTYTISIKVTESILNDNGNGNIDNIDVPIAVSVQINVDKDYEDKVTVNIDISKITLHIDDAGTLEATVTPSSAKRDLEWYSSDRSVVTVEERPSQKGRVVATGYGTANITAEVNGVKDTCTVVVERCTYDQKDVEARFLKSPATCSSYAVYYKSCKCGYHGTSTFVDKAGGYADHAYDDWTIITEATETEEGLKRRTCSDCGDVDEETISAIPHTHSWATEYSKDASNHWYACAGCSEIKSKASHTWDAGAVIKPATEKETGVKTYICTVCKQTKTETIPTLSPTKTYTITYNYNYDDGPVKTETKYHGETYTISNSIIPICPSTETSTTIISYNFEGWATSEEGSVIYQPGDTYTQNSNLTLYAQWTTSIAIKPQSGTTVYSIIYDANGGSNAPDHSSAVKAGITIALSTKKPTRSGYTFLGWSLDKNDNVSDYQPGDRYTVNGATTLYAVWKKQSSGGGSNKTYIISGNITAYATGGNYTIILYDANGEEDSLMISRSPDYEFEATPGRYTLEVSKAKHITRRYEVVVCSEDVTQNVTLYLKGDINGDGIVDRQDVNCIGEIDYTVSSNAITVVNEKTCRVGYLSDGKYIAVAATANGNSGYDFIIPDEATEVILIIAGDISGDGVLDYNDKELYESAIMSDDSSLSPEQFFAADVNVDDEIDIIDIILIAKSMLDKEHNFYKGIEW